MISKHPCNKSRFRLAEKRIRAMEQGGRHAGYRMPKDYTPLRSRSHERIKLRRQAVRWEPMVPSIYVWGGRLYVGQKARPKLKQSRLFALRIRIQHQCRRGAHGHRA
jgi:hypothetical protein